MYLQVLVVSKRLRVETALVILDAKYLRTRAPSAVSPICVFVCLYAPTTACEPAAASKMLHMFRDHTALPESALLLCVPGLRHEKCRLNLQRYFTLNVSFALSWRRIICHHAVANWN